MAMAQVEVLSVERRRRWSRSEKERLVAASFEPGMSASAVARSADIHVSQLFRWRKRFCERAVPSAPALIPVTVVAEAATEAATLMRSRCRAGLIEITLSGGRRVRVDRDVDAQALRRVLDALGER